MILPYFQKVGAVQRFSGAAYVCDTFTCTHTNANICCTPVALLGSLLQMEIHTASTPKSICLLRISCCLGVSVIVICRPPGHVGNFLDELDTLLSLIPEHDCPFLVLGDVNIHLDL